jgi:ribosomal 30S subunit maturation factor RimM
VLFEVRGDKGVVLIPAVDEWVDDVNDADHVIRMSLPEGLLEVN